MNSEEVEAKDVRCFVQISHISMNGAYCRVLLRLSLPTGEVRTGLLSLATGGNRNNCIQEAVHKLCDVVCELLLSLTKRMKLA